ncbi:MAG: RHS repeat domain-containing protein [Burkholderiales bacterium]
MYSNDKQGLWHAWLSVTLMALSQWPGALRSRTRGLWLQVALPLMLGCALLVAASAASAATETVTYIHTDVSGSPLAATDSNGAVVWKESYRAYGERWLQQSGTGQQTQWFHGKEQDAATGLQYFGARYYDPAVGRFLGVDPVDFQEGNLHSFNRFTYGNNNPVKYIDPDGKFPLLVLIPVVWSATGAVTSGAVSAGAQQMMAGQIRWGGVGGVLDAAGDGLILGPVFGASAAKGSGADVVKSGLSEARAARDALAAELAPLRGRAPATVTGGYNVKTGEVAARSCGGGLCAENHVVDALGGVKSDIRFTEAVRPRTGAEVPVCNRCEVTFGREPFPSNTRFKSDE